jgi:hypothetical protein
VVHHDDRRRRGTSAVVGVAAALTLVLAACGTTATASAPPATTARANGANGVAGTASPSGSAPGGTTGTAPNLANAPTNTVWLCKPGIADNPCEGNFDTSQIAADGTRTVQHAAPATDPPIDCFYVYPTVSGQKGVNADLTIDPAEIGVARAQAARFSQVCKVYAPMYRQLTLGAIGNRGGINAQALASAYGDVENAWLDYLAHDNNGRGVVLIGHSQGAGQLIALIKRQIDNQPDVRKQLVSAVLLGGNVMVPAGQDVGGSFNNVPACRRSDQTGCVVAYSTFLNPPPANSMFGRGRGGQEVLCTNPAALGGGSGTLVDDFPTGANGAVGTITSAGPADPNPWVSYTDLYTGECQNANGADVLHVTPTPGPNDKRPVVTESLGPTWGLHLVDVNIALGNLVDLVGNQAKAYHG